MDKYLKWLESIHYENTEEITKDDKSKYEFMCNHYPKCYGCPLWFPQEFPEPCDESTLKRWEEGVGIYGEA